VQPSERAYVTRIVRFVVTLVVIELLLFVIAKLAPAMATLFRPVYWIVAALFVVPIWHAARKRAPGHDRRQADRRDH
jgi:hypothetical protein